MWSTLGTSVMIIGEVARLLRWVVRLLSSTLPNSGGLGDRDRRFLSISKERIFGSIIQTLERRIARLVTPTQLRTLVLTLARERVFLQ